MPQPSFRTRLPEAETIFGSLWSRQGNLVQGARVVARSIRAAHGEAPDSWEFTLFRDYCRLNVGQIAVLELGSDVLIVYCLGPSGVRDARGIGRFRDFREYRAVDVRTERWSVDADSISKIPRPLLDRHRQLVVAAARAKRHSPFRKHHSPAAVEVIARLVQGQVPQPDYWRTHETDSVESSSLAQAEVASPSGLFGTPAENAAVEQAAVAAVIAHFKSLGWSVQTVEADRCGYDLQCSRGQSERHVEVKGTSGVPDQFVLTPLEMRRAQDDPKFTLVLVGHALGSGRTIEQWERQSFEDVFRIEPLRYVARRSSRAG